MLLVAKLELEPMQIWLRALNRACLLEAGVTVPFPRVLTSPTGQQAPLRKAVGVGLGTFAPTQWVCRNYLLTDGAKPELTTALLPLAGTLQGRSVYSTR